MSLPGFSVRNPVAANLLMWVLVVAGTYSAFTLVREMFPESAPNQIVIRTPYPGATPEEMDRAVTRRLERGLEGLKGAKEVRSAVFEGVSVTTVELERGADPQRAMGDVRSKIDLVRPDLPSGAEDPEPSLVEPYVPVIAVALYGDVAENVLRDAVLRVRDALLDQPAVSEVLVAGSRPREIWIEVRPERLEEYGLTFEDVGRRVQAGNLELPGGQLKTLNGNVRVRTSSESLTAIPLEDLVIREGPDGRVVLLRDVGAVRETFEDRVESGRFGGKPATLLTVFRAPGEDAVSIAQSVKRFTKEFESQLPDGLHLETITDLSRFIEERIDLMVRNGRAGFVLVALALALFLNLRVAFWVAAGLAISFMGTFLVLRVAGETINLLSLFGLIVVLGIVVDDAIVIGERVFVRQRSGMPPKEAAILGASEVALPVAAAVTTTMAAFLPLAFLGGTIGAFLRVLPIVVIAALSMSLVEAFLILPAHLAHVRKARRRGVVGRWIERVSDARHRLFEDVIPGWFAAVLRPLCAWRYVTLSACMVLLFGAAGLFSGGVVPFVLIQELDAEALTITVEMTAGTPESRTAEVLRELEDACLALPEQSKVFAILGTSFDERGAVTSADPATVGQITLELKPSAERSRRSEEVVAELRGVAARVVGANNISVLARQGGPGGQDIEIRVRGEDPKSLEGALEHVRSVLDDYPAVEDIEDDFRLGKIEAQLDVGLAGASIGLLPQALAFQVRNALFGFEAQELQRENEEVKVRVILPEAARDEVADLMRLRVSTPSGGRPPLEEVAQTRTTRGQATISRVDGKRSFTVLAQVNDAKGNTAEIQSAVDQRLSDISERFPGVSLSFEGQKKEAAESLGSLKWGFPAALFLIYAIIAILFRSYLQPLVVMAAIPFSIAGAVIGHAITGYPWTLLSTIGAVALTGIVVNDSLILVDFINRKRAEGIGAVEAAVAGSKERLRPILLTSLTTICGLAPLMLEKSFQAQFLIPMAVSLVFGLLFSTVLIPILNPVLYLMGSDFRNLARWTWSGSGSSSRESV